jgi:hypothetical protein
MRSRRLLPAALVLLPLVLLLAVSPLAHAYNDFRVKYVEADPDDFQMLVVNRPALPLTEPGQHPANVRDRGEPLSSHESLLRKGHAGEDLSHRGFWECIARALRDLRGM